MCNSAGQCKGEGACACSCDGGDCQGAACQATQDNGDGMEGEAFEAACGLGGFPVPPDRMQRCMREWARGRDGKERSFYQPTGTDGDEDVKLFVLKVQFASNISWTSPMEVLQTDHAWWEAYVTGQLASAPAGLRGGYQTGEAWWWMDTIDHMQR